MSIEPNNDYYWEQKLANDYSLLSLKKGANHEETFRALEERSLESLMKLDREDLLLTMFILRGRKDSWWEMCKVAIDCNAFRSMKRLLEVGDDYTNSHLLFRGRGLAHALRMKRLEIALMFIERKIEVTFGHLLDALISADREVVRFVLTFLDKDESYLQCFLSGDALAKLTPEQLDGFRATVSWLEETTTDIIKPRDDANIAVLTQDLPRLKRSTTDIDTEVVHYAMKHCPPEIVKAMVGKGYSTIKELTEFIDDKAPTKEAYDRLELLAGLGVRVATHSLHVYDLEYATALIKTGVTTLEDVVAYVAYSVCIDVAPTCKEVLSALLERDPDVEKVRKAFEQLCDDQGVTMSELDVLLTDRDKLHLTIRFGSLDTINELFDSKVSSAQMIKMTTTAIVVGRPEVFELLLDRIGHEEVLDEGFFHLFYFISKLEDCVPLYTSIRQERKRFVDGVRWLDANGYIDPTDEAHVALVTEDVERLKTAMAKKHVAGSYEKEDGTRSTLVDPGPVCPILEEFSDYTYDCGPDELVKLLIENDCEIYDSSKISPDRVTRLIEMGAVFAEA